MDLQEQISNNTKYCKYCMKSLEDIAIEILKCLICNLYVHTKCLERGGVPGSLIGDIFYEYKCSECSLNNIEEFVRQRMTWLQAIVLVLYHMNIRNKALARKGYFHWKTHIATFIDRNWNILFKSDMKRRKKWIGTISGTLSHYSPTFFISGTTVLSEQGWWALSYPKLPPNIVVEINEELVIEKQKCKESKIPFHSVEKLHDILQNKPYITEAMLKSNDSLIDNSVIACDNASTIIESSLSSVQDLLTTKKKIKKDTNLYQGSLLPTVDNILTLFKRKNIVETDDIPSSNVFKKLNIGPSTSSLSKGCNSDGKDVKEKPPENSNYLDPLCYYNTSLECVNQVEPKQTQMRLTGSVRKEFILSPYSSICLSPFIFRTVSLNPLWLQLMDELKYKVNCKFQPRASLDFAYVQPNHIPALNSLCHQFFWNGINLTDTLQFPEYTCVVLYKKLIVGFVCVIPNVKADEIYLSFIFTRPAWRKCGIARLMLYHIIQISGGRDITLHIATSNPALLLFQRYGFKIQHLAKNFYEKYLPSESTESRNAFYCKLNL